MWFNLIRERLLVLFSISLYSFGISENSSTASRHSIGNVFLLISEVVSDVPQGTVLEPTLSGCPRKSNKKIVDAMPNLISVIEKKEKKTGIQHI